MGRILLVIGKYLPAKSAGIENYSHWLAGILLQNNHIVDVAILDSEKMEPYNYELVNAFPLKKGFESFVQLIKNTHYDICHIQEYSGINGINIEWFKAAKANCSKVYFTFHLPYLTCYKNDFRYKGVEDCNNFTLPERCLTCIIATKLSYSRVSGINLKNIGIDLVTPLLKRSVKIGRLKKRIELREDILRQLIYTCDQIFIYGVWFKRILIKNGFDSPKLNLIPHISKPSTNETETRDLNIKYRILFVGRIEEQKGLHLLCKAMKLISVKELTLNVAGNIVDEQYFEDCVREYSFDYLGVLPRSQLLSSLCSYDFLILPSVFTEMYSLIVREAFYEQLPVIASAAKGNMEVIKENRNGFIFEYDNYKDLARVLDKAYELKHSGWTPEFEEEKNTNAKINEILSYYI